ncbi:MAG TPA: hypothetical protein VMH35_03150 [Streptosporangiaceae bacterium]|nr:hypothetical protein [Streptosporangiaceae bacterium]
MNTQDWITLLGAVVAALAIVVSARIALIAVNIQRKQAEFEAQQAKLEAQQARKEADRDLAEVAQNLAHLVAQLFTGPVGGPDAATASSEVMGLVIRANELSDDSSDTNWFLHYSLAMAYGWLWEIDKASASWEKALADADSGHSRVTVLAGEAVFHYNIGSQAQIEAGRTCFDRAEEILVNDFPDDLGREQLTGILSQRAGLEYGAGQRDESAKIYAKAWQLGETITSAWRRVRASGFLGNNFLQTFGHDQAGIPDTIPTDLVRYAAGLLQQAQQAAFVQQAAIAQQSITQPPTTLQHGHSNEAANQQSAEPVGGGPHSGTPR